MPLGINARIAEQDPRPEQGSKTPRRSVADDEQRRVSLLHAQGETWARIGERVGYADLATTARTYMHVLGDEAELDCALCWLLHPRARVSLARAYGCDPQLAKRAAPRVNCLIPLPSAFMTNSARSARPPRLLVRTIFLPSGDQEFGLLFTVPPLECVSCLSPVPSVRTVNTFADVGGPNAGLPKRTLFPSGEQSTVPV